MKRLAAKTGEYQKDGQTKGEYIKLGVIGQSQNGEYLLLDPTVNLAGVLQKQNAYAIQQNKQVSTSVMVSVFDDSQQQGNGQRQPQKGGYQQQPSMQRQDDAPPS